jgi:hypothetical protein
LFNERSLDSGFACARDDRGGRGGLPRNRHPDRSPQAEWRDLSFI